MLSILTDVRDEDMPAAAARPVHERHRPRHHWTRIWPGHRHSAITQAPAHNHNPGNAPQPAHYCGRSPATAQAQDIAMVLQQIVGDGYELDRSTARQGQQARRQPLFQIG